MFQTSLQSIKTNITPEPIENKHVWDKKKKLNQLHCWNSIYSLPIVSTIFSHSVTMETEGQTALRPDQFPFSNNFHICRQFGDVWQWKRLPDELFCFARSIIWHLVWLRLLPDLCYLINELHFLPSHTVPKQIFCNHRMCMMPSICDIRFIITNDLKLYLFHSLFASVALLYTTLWKLVTYVFVSRLLCL